MKLYVTLSDETLEQAVQNVDLVLRAKNTNVIDLIIRDENELALDITGSEIYFMIKPTASTADASATINKKITTFTYPTSGELDIELTSAETTSLLGNYIYQIKIKYNSKFYTLVEGTVCFQKSIIDRET